MGALVTSLAMISTATYTDSLVGLPPGFSPLALPGTNGGVYQNGNAFAAVTTGQINGQTVVVLSFRGSDDRQDWLNNLRDINADYAKLSPLISALEDYALQTKLPVLVTGHSLGGALVQVFMADHPETEPVSYQGVTFGSPGGLISQAPDPRITNYEIADDLIPYVGEYRTEIGAQALSDPLYAFALASVAVGATDGRLQPIDVYESLPSFTADYVNRGETVILPNSDGQRAPFTPGELLDPFALLRIANENQGRHDVRVYTAETAGVADPTTYVGGPESNLVKLWSLYASFSLGGGLDAVQARGSRSEYFITRVDVGSLEMNDLVAGRDGRDFLSGVERVYFEDSVLAFDFDGVSGQIFRLYDAAFDRTPDTEGITYWVSKSDAGMSLSTISSSFLASEEFRLNFGSELTNEDFVEILYRNALGRAPETEGFDYWMDVLNNGTSRASVLLGFSESPEAQALVAAQIQDGITLNHAPDLIV